MTTLRAATAKDVETLFEIQKAASLAAFGHIFPPDRCTFPDEDVQTRWRDALESPEEEVLLAQAGGDPVGLAAFSPGWLGALHVVPTAWGRGIGSRLHDAAIERRRTAGDEAMHLWVLEENFHARGFYERRGWRPDGETRVTPFPPYPTALRYALRIAARC